MTISVQSILLGIGIACMLISALKLRSDYPRWKWFEAGVLLCAVSLFVSISFR